MEYDYGFAVQTVEITNGNLRLRIAAVKPTIVAKLDCFQKMLVQALVNTQCAKM
ncbi:hypothetical protein ACVWYF_000389 [Hymenobacter sp. UYAg731]